jgi:hypothetical protein
MSNGVQDGTVELPFGSKACLPASNQPELHVVIDTEEEFDWGAPPKRSSTSVAAMRHVERAQRIFQRFAIRPAYVVSYPVASQPDGYLPLLELLHSGACEIGAHPHPWVNPPDDEELSTRNTFICNLPLSLQRAKIELLCGQIEAVFGVRPTMFKAGRYGIDRATLGLLAELGFEIDLSVCPQFDFTLEGGPSFMTCDSHPFLMGNGLLEMPCTVDYTGWAGPVRPALHRLASRKPFEILRAPGVLVKIGAVNRVMLSPEGYSFAETRALTEELLTRGHRTFVFSFHSPSLDPGHTPYVRSQQDLIKFLDEMERFFDFFFGECRGVGSTPTAFRAALEPVQ